MAAERAGGMCFKGVEGCLLCMNGVVVGPLQLWVLGPLQGGGLRCAAMQMRGRDDTSLSASRSSTLSVREVRRQGGHRRYLSAEHMYVLQTGKVMVVAAAAWQQQQQQQQERERASEGGRLRQNEGGGVAAQANRSRCGGAAESSAR